MNHAASYASQPSATDVAVCMWLARHYPDELTPIEQEVYLQPSPAAGMDRGDSARVDGH